MFEMIFKTIDIWEDTSFEYESFDGFIPTLDTYILDGDKRRPAILICPGGGYSFTSPREAEPIAIKYNAAGFHVFVLYYSVSPSRHPQPLLDVSRAMCILRQNADKWNIDGEKILTCGFSAGGHLAASLGVHWNKSYINNIPGIEIGKNKPNGLILGYPVISSGDFFHKGSITNLLGDRRADADLLKEVSLELHIHEGTPPTFLWHTYNDGSVPLENTLLFAEGLRKEDIPFELHIYPDGPHGLSLANEETTTGDMGLYPNVATWMDLSIEWIKRL